MKADLINISSIPGNFRFLIYRAVNEFIKIPSMNPYLKKELETVGFTLKRGLINEVWTGYLTRNQCVVVRNALEYKFGWHAAKEFDYLLDKCESIAFLGTLGD